MHKEGDLCCVKAMRTAERVKYSAAPPRTRVGADEGNANTPGRFHRHALPLSMTMRCIKYLRQAPVSLLLASAFAHAQTSANPDEALRAAAQQAISTSPDVTARLNALRHHPPPQSARNVNAAAPIPSTAQPARSANGSSTP